MTDKYKQNYLDNIERFKKKGYPVPTFDMIKTEEEIEMIKKAAVINNAVLDLVGEKIHEGMSTEEINTIVATKTKEMGGICAPQDYEGFPKSVCTSVNDVVCHGIPSPKEILKSGDIVNVDCTTILNGKYADASRMYMIGNVSEAAKKLVRVTKESLDIAVSNLKPYSRLRDIGFYIDSHCKKNGFHVVHEIGGHGVGNDFHEDPFVYHYGTKNTGMVLFPGMVITVEPMVNEISRYVCLQDDPDPKVEEWTIYTRDGGLSAQFEYTILITLDGIEIIAR